MAEIQISSLSPSVLAKWCVTMLFASVAPLVQMMSSGWQPRNAASFSRASASAMAARVPYWCMDDGLPPIFSVTCKPRFARLAHDGRGGVVIEVNHRPDRILLRRRWRVFCARWKRRANQILSATAKCPQIFFGEFFKRT
jgi:hypothetical protein